MFQKAAKVRSAAPSSTQNLFTKQPFDNVDQYKPRLKTPRTFRESVFEVGVAYGPRCQAQLAHELLLPPHTPDDTPLKHVCHLANRRELGPL